MRRWLAFFASYLLLGMLAATAWSEASFPVPQDKNQIFYVQRSMNANTIVYAARIRADGQLDPDKPVEVYWRRFNDQGARQDLSYLERTVAFGVKAEKIAGKPSAFRMRVVSYPQRSAILSLVDGKPQLVTKIAGVPSRLDHAFLHLDESGSMPKVVLVDLVGHALDTGQEMRESFKP